MGGTPMQTANTDRNLLFGVLAVQMDFISRDALIRAMNAWVLEKAKGLGEILVEQKALSSERRTLLEALVQEHLKQHNNDAEQSLAAVSSVGSVHAELKQISDTDVQASLAHVSVARAADADPWGTPAPSVGAATSSGMRFRILRPHAKGGAGAGLDCLRRGAAPRGRPQGNPGPLRGRCRQPIAFHARSGDHRRTGASAHRAGVRPGQVPRRPALLY